MSLLVWVDGRKNCEKSPPGILAEEALVPRDFPFLNTVLVELSEGVLLLLVKYLSLLVWVDGRKNCGSAGIATEDLLASASILDSDVRYRDLTALAQMFRCPKRGLN